jgi:hypothetical protein
MKGHLWLLGAAGLALVACKDQGDKRTAQTESNPGRGPSSRSGDAQSRDVSGIVARVAGDRVEVRVPGSPDVVLIVEPGTVVQVDGQPAKASQISEGTPVRATYLVAPDGALKALRVEVLSPRVK